MKNIYKILSLLLIFCSVLFFATACGDEPENKTVTEWHLRLSQDQAVVNFGDSFILSYEYDGEDSVVWKSSDENVLTVTDGVVYAISEGVANVTVSAGDLNASCEIMVVFDEKEIAISFQDFKSNYYIDEVGSVNANVLYMGKTLQNVEFSYKSSDNGVMEVADNGNFVTKKSGNSSITVFVKFDKYEFLQTREVSVLPDYGIEFNVDYIELDAIAEFQGQTFNNRTVVETSICYRGKIITETSGFDVTFASSDDNVFTVSDTGVVIAHKTGNANLKCELWHDTAKIYEQELSVSVSAPQVDLTATNKQVVRAGQFNTINLDALQGMTLVSASVVKENLEINAEISNGKVKIPDYVSGTDLQIILTTETVSAIVKADVYIGIGNADELKKLCEASEGYYRLTADIDMSETDWQNENAIQFKGWFNGNNHKISGLKISGEYGLFYMLGKTSLVSNLILEDVLISGEYRRTGALAFAVVDANVKNVNADVCLLNGNAGGGLFGSVSGHTILKDITVHTYQPSADKNAYGAITGVCNGKIEFNNVKVYSNLSLCSTVDDTLNSAKNTVNSKHDGCEIQSPEEYSLSFNCYSDSVQNFSISGTMNSLKAYLGKLFISANSNVFSCASASETDLMASQKVEILTKSNSGSILNYYYISVVGEIGLDQSNFATELANYPNDKNLVLYLKENIDFAGATSDASARDFSGTFDGKGYAIKNLYGQLFGNIGGATIKNVAIIDAKRMKGEAQGILASQPNATTVLQNVLITTTNEWKEAYSGGIFRALWSDVTLKDVVMIAYTKSSSVDFGYIAGYGSKGQNVNNDNCYYVLIPNNGNGGTYLPIGLRTPYISTNDDSLATMAGSYKTYSTVSAFDGDGNKNLSEEMLTMYDMYVHNRNFVAISEASDFENISADSTDYYYLTNDIDFAGATSGSSATNFAGVLDGRGYAIKNLKGQLFNNIGGATVKNIAFIDAVRKENEGTLAYQPSATTVIQNVLITTTNEWKISNSGGIFRVLWSNVTLKDVVMVAKTKSVATDIGYIAGFAGTGNQVINDNCYYVLIPNNGNGGTYLPIGLKSPAANYINSADDSNAAMKGTFKTYTNISDFTDDGNKTLSDELAAMCEKYL